MKDWSIARRGDEPGDFWSQSFCYGAIDIPEPAPNSVHVRFRNDGGKRYLRAEAHLVYRTASADGTRVTFDWIDGTAPHRASNIFTSSHNAPWQLETGKSVHTRWVEFEPLPDQR